MGTNAAGSPSPAPWSKATTPQVASGDLAVIVIGNEARTSATNTDDWQVAGSDADTVIRRCGRHVAVFAHDQSPYDLPGRQSTLISHRGLGRLRAQPPTLFKPSGAGGMSTGREPTGHADPPVGLPRAARDAGIPSRRQARPSQAARTISVLIETLRVETEEFVPKAEGTHDQHSGRKTTSCTRLNPRERSNNGIRDQTPRCQWL
jgi:hypothetical protein